MKKQIKELQDVWINECDKKECPIVDYLLKNPDETVMPNGAKRIPVTSERNDIVSIEIVGLTMFISYESGQVCEYRFEFKGGSL